MKKHKLIVIVILILMMSCVVTGCVAKKVAKKCYDENSDMSTVEVQFMAEIDIGSWSFDDDYYGIAGLYDTSGNKQEITLLGLWSTNEKRVDKRGAVVVNEFEFKGHYKGYIYRIWYMNGDDALELEYNIYELDKRIEYLKKHAYIIEWKL